MFDNDKKVKVGLHFTSDSRAIQSYLELGPSLYLSRGDVDGLQNAVTKQYINCDIFLHNYRTYMLFFFLFFFFNLIHCL